MGEKSGGEKQKGGAEGRKGVNPGWELAVEELAWLNSRIEGLDGLEEESMMLVAVLQMGVEMSSDEPSNSLSRGTEGKETF